MNGTLPYFYMGSLYSANGCIIEEPAILVTKDDIFCKYGSYENILKEFTRRQEAYISAGFPEEAENLVMFSFSKYTGIPTEKITYIIRRMLQYTATGFITKFFEELGKQETFMSWLDSEMERIPIDISSNNWR
jgi:hypothetical protein